MDKLIFFTLFFGFLMLKEIEYILICLVGLSLIIIAIDKKINIFLKVLKSILFFNLGVSIGFIIISILKNSLSWEYLIYINSKVFLLSLFVIWFFSKINVVKFFSFSKDLSYLLTISLSQIYSYKKTFEDFRLAFKSRVISIKDKEKKFITNTFKFFFNKALKDSKEKALALKARGFFEQN